MGTQNIKNKLIELDQLIGAKTLLSGQHKHLYKDLIEGELVAEYYRGQEDAYENIHQLISDLILHGTDEEEKQMHEAEGE